MGGKSRSRSRSRSRSHRKKREEKHDRREREKHDNRRPSGGATMREIEQSGLGTGAEKTPEFETFVKKGGGVRILSKQKIFTRNCDKGG